MPAGRPTEYQPRYAEEARRICARFGATDADLADVFQVSVTTIKNWKMQHEEFLAALSIGKDVADQRVVQSLYQRAIGYEHDEVDIRVVEGQIVQTPIRKYYPPDSTACIYWTKNRMRGEWSDKVEQEIKAEINDKVDKEDLARRVIFMLAERATKGQT